MENVPAKGRRIRMVVGCVLADEVFEKHFRVLGFCLEDQNWWL